jgi:hypothetical protein
MFATRNRRGLLVVPIALLFLCFTATETYANCKIVTNPGGVSFDIDPSLPGPIVGTITSQSRIKCRKSAFNVVATSLNGGASFVMKKGSDAIPYNFSYVTSGPWTKKWTTYDLIIGSSVDKVYYQDAPIGSGYTDTITLTVIF